MNKNDYIKNKVLGFMEILKYPCPAYLKNNDPDHNRDMYTQEYGDDLPEGLEYEDLDYWNEDLLIGFRLTKEIDFKSISNNNPKEINILEVYNEGFCGYFLTRYVWLWTKEDFDNFIGNIEDILESQSNSIMMALYIMFKDNV